MCLLTIAGLVNLDVFKRYRKTEGGNRNMEIEFLKGKMAAEKISI